MVAKPPAKLPAWAEEYLKSRRPPTKAEIAVRKRALTEALEIRARLDIRPLKVADLIRELRDEG
jgi:hypothetical protein